MTAGSASRSLGGAAGRAAGTGTFDRLRICNVIVGLIHLVQAIMLLLLSNEFGLPVTGRFLAGADHFRDAHGDDQRSGSRGELGPVHFRLHRRDRPLDHHRDPDNRGIDPGDRG